MSEVVDINPKKSEVSGLPKSTEVSFVPMSDLNEWQIFFEAKQVKAITEVIKGYTYFKDRDVLLAKITPCFENGKAGIAKGLVNGIGFGSTEFIVLRAKSNVLPEYIYYLVSNSKFLEEGKRHMTGSAGQQRVAISFIENYEIPLLSLDDQKILVDKFNKQQLAIEANRSLIEVFNDQIKEKIAGVWGE